MRRYFNSFSAFRFLAFLTVFSLHVGCYDPTGGYLGSGAAWAVSFFFINSAFLYGYKNHGKKLVYRDTLSILYKKVKKIYPVYFLTLLLWLPYCGLLTLREDALQTVIKFLLCATMTQGLAVNLDYAYAFNPASWFVSVLMILMLFVVPISNLANKYLKSVKRCIVAMIVLLLLDMAYVIVMNALNAPKTEFLYVFPTCRIFEFAIGIILGHVSALSEHKKSKRRVMTIVEVMTILVGVLSVLFANRLFPQFNNAVNWIIPNCIIMYVFAREGGAISEFFKKRTFGILGKLSFPAYLLHQHIFLTFYLVTGVTTGSSDVASRKAKLLRYCYLLGICLLLAAVAGKIDCSVLFEKLEKRRLKKEMKKMENLFVVGFLY